jgi:hypothetical protein
LDELGFFWLLGLASALFAFALFGLALSTIAFHLEAVTDFGTQKA